VHCPHVAPPSAFANEVAEHDDTVCDVASCGNAGPPVIELGQRSGHLPMVVADTEQQSRSFRSVRGLREPAVSSGSVGT
jgi:hypothetical protein